MTLSRAHLVNISVFMRYACEAGKLTNVNEVLAFAATASEVQKAIDEIDAAKKLADAAVMP